MKAKATNLKTTKTKEDFIVNLGTTKDGLPILATYRELAYLDWVGRTLLEKEKIN